jgi:hypothetical protein
MALLRLAVLRWPERRRAEVHHEWSAELHVLAAEGRHWQMLRFAASLAAARPTAGLGARLWRAVRLVVLAPAAALALLIGVLFVVNLASMQVFPFLLQYQEVQVTLFTVLTLGAALPLAWLGRRWSMPGRSTPLLLAVTVPGFVACTVLYLVGTSTSKTGLHAPGFALFFAGLGGLLVVVLRRARAGRRRSAWWIGVLGAVAIADVATMLPLLRSGWVDLPVASAPLWLFTTLTGSDFGLPVLTPEAVFTILDLVELDPLFYIVFTGLALGAVMAHAQAAAATSLAVVQPEGP